MKKQTSFILLSIFSLFLTLSSCNSEKIFPPSEEQSNTYYPLKDGNEVYYEIYDLEFNILETDSSHYFTKETVELISSTTDSTYALIHVAISDSINGIFEPNSVYSVRFYSNTITTNVDNTRFLDLKFPLESGASFDYNFFNTQEELLATIINFETNRTVEDFTGIEEYQDIIEVETAQSFNFIETIHEFKVYQKDKGLVYAYDINLDTQPGQKPIGYEFIKKRVLN